MVSCGGVGGGIEKRRWCGGVGESGGIVWGVRVRASRVSVCRGMTVANVCARGWGDGGCVGRIMVGILTFTIL